MSEHTEKRNVAISSVLAAVFLTTFKIVVGYKTNSLGILSEAAHSGMDLLAAGITLAAVSYADRPADEDHPFGHGKLENISAFIETLLLVLTCGWVLYEAIGRLLMRNHHVETTVWSFVVMGVSILVDIGRSRVLYRMAKKHKSQALEADALHFSSDIWSSVTVIAGLFLVWLGYPELDAVAAIVVALLILFVSFRLGRRTIDALMDRVPLGLSKKMRAAVESVPGVEEVRNIRLLASGSKVFVDAVVAIRRTLPFQSAHAIMDNIEQAVYHLEPSATVVVHAEPVASAHETIVDSIRMIVMERGLRSPHNLEVHLSGGQYYIDFDVEYPRGQTFGEAHEMTEELERHIRRDIPAIGKLTIHMEEIEESEHPIENVTETELQLAGVVQAHVEKNADVLACKDITLLREGTRFTVTLTCLIEKSKTLDEVHSIISTVENDLYRTFKNLRRVVIHAEPG